MSYEVTSMDIENARRLLRDAREHSIEGYEEGTIALDAGCGDGAALLLMGANVGTTGEVVGIDTDSVKVDAVNTLATDSGYGGIVRAQVADASDIPYPDRYFDRVRAERLLAVVGNPSAVVDEMVRVLKLGGTISMIETDWNSLSIGANNTAYERKLLSFILDQMMPGGIIGKRLYATMCEHNKLSKPTVHVYNKVVTDLSVFDALGSSYAIEQAATSAGVVTAQEVSDWREELQSLQDSGSFFATFNIVETVANRII